MFKYSSNGIVTVNRGDSFELPIILRFSTSSLDYCEYELQEHDVLYIGIMEPNQSFEEAIIRKRITKDDITDQGILVRFWPEDTMCVLPGKYYYQVKLATPVTTDDGLRYDVETVIDKTLFYIQE